MAKLFQFLESEKLRQMSAGTTGAKDTRPAKAGVEDEWEQADTKVTPESKRKQPGEFPSHEISVKEAKRSPEQQQARQNFLRKAVGGSPSGFITRDSASHQMARGLARTGHLQHMGSMADEKTGKDINHWQLTEKGLALAHGSPLNPNAAQRTPLMPAMPNKASGFGEGRKMQIQKRQRMMGR